MDVSGISSIASAISTQKTVEASSEAQVALVKKQSDQQEQVASTLIQSAAPAAVARPDKGTLLAIA